MSSRSTPPREVDHHGDLRRALLDHAVELARADGPDAIVLRDVQRRAGVSNSAAYRHYADRAELLSAVADYAEKLMADRMAAAVAAVPNTGPRSNRALARLRQSGQAYVDFALAEPGLFRTAMSPVGLNRRAALAAVDPADHHPFAILIQCIDDLVAEGVIGENRRYGLEAAAWAAVHGLAVLFLDGPLGALSRTDKQRVTDRLLDTFVAGVH